MSEVIQALKGALDYTQLYRRQTFVIKVGGEVLADPATLDGISRQIALLESLSIRPVIVHGGGPQATELSRRLDVPTEMVAGRRVTTSQTLEIAKMIYAGTVNVDLLAALRRQNVSAVGLSGVDANLISATKRPPVSVVDDDGAERVVDFGLVGDVQSIDVGVLHALLQAGHVPVISSLGSTDDGEVLNINSDSIAQALASELSANKLIFLTSSPGILRDASDPKSLVAFADPAELHAMLESGSIQGGMRPKVEACLSAVKSGVRRTHVIDGRREDSLLLELFTGTGCGTMIVGRKEMDSYRLEING